MPDEDVRAALAPYGRVVEVRKERWRVDGIRDKGSTVRSVALNLKPRVTMDDLPHQLRVGGDKAVVVVAGSPPPPMFALQHQWPYTARLQSAVLFLPPSLRA